MHCVLYFCTGSCWSGPNAGQTYAEDGESDPEMCISFGFKKCEATNPLCVGKQETNFVYAIDNEVKRLVLFTMIHKAEPSITLI